MFASRNKVYLCVYVRVPRNKVYLCVNVRMRISHGGVLNKRSKISLHEHLSKKIYVCVYMYACIGSVTTEYSQASTRKSLSCR